MIKVKMVRMLESKKDIYYNNIIKTVFKIK